jgi:hypothetical protein
MRQLNRIAAEYGVIIYHNTSDQMILWTPETLDALDYALSKFQNAIGAENFIDFMAVGTGNVKINISIEEGGVPGELGHWEPNTSTLVIDPDLLIERSDGYLTILAETIVHELGGEGYLAYLDLGLASISFEEHTEWGWNHNPNGNPQTGPTPYANNYEMEEDMFETLMVITLYGPQGGGYSLTPGRIAWFNEIVPGGNWGHKIWMPKR